MAISEEAVVRLRALHSDTARLYTDVIKGRGMCTVLREASGESVHRLSKKDAQELAAFYARIAELLS
jgi:hypothetical protein